jgi:hypothetical protein
MTTLSLRRLWTMYKRVRAENGLGERASSLPKPRFMPARALR